MYSIEERLAIAEEKLKRMDEIERQLKRTQDALMQLAIIYDKNFDILSGRVSRKSDESDGFFSDFFNW